MTHIAAPGDTIRVLAEDVTLRGSDNTTAAVTAGLTGTVSLLDWASGEVEVGPTDIELSAGDDWYVDLAAPDAGHYRIVVVIAKDGAQRTLHGELKVEAPPT